MSSNSSPNIGRFPTGRSGSLIVEERRRSGSLVVDEKRLIDAARTADEPEVRRLLTCGVNPDVQSSDGGTALHRAAHYGHTKVIDWLLVYGANPNAATKSGDSPVLVATSNGHYDAVVRLVAAGADVKQVNVAFKSAIDYAKTDAMRALLNGYLFPAQRDECYHRWAEIAQQAGRALPRNLANLQPVGHLRAEHDQLLEQLHKSERQLEELEKDLNYQRHLREAALQVAAEATVRSDTDRKRSEEIQAVLKVEQEQRRALEEAMSQRPSEAQAQQQVGQLQNALQRAIAQHAQLASALQQTQTQLEEAEKRASEFEKRVAHLSRRRDSAKTKLAAEKERRAAVEAVVAGLRGDHQAQTLQLQALQDQLRHHTDARPTAASPVLMAVLERFQLLSLFTKQTSPWLAPFYHAPDRLAVCPVAHLATLFGLPLARAALLRIELIHAPIVEALFSVERGLVLAQWLDASLMPLQRGMTRPETVSIQQLAVETLQAAPFSLSLGEAERLLDKCVLAELLAEFGVSPWLPGLLLTTEPAQHALDFGTIYKRFTEADFLRVGVPARLIPPLRERICLVDKLRSFRPRLSYGVIGTILNEGVSLSNFSRTLHVPPLPDLGLSMAELDGLRETLMFASVYLALEISPRSQRKLAEAGMSYRSLQEDRWTVENLKAKGRLHPSVALSLLERLRAAQALLDLGQHDPAFLSMVIDPAHLQDPMTMHAQVNALIQQALYFGTPVAVKTLAISTSLRLFEKEVSAWLHLRHPHVVTLFGVTTTEPFQLVMELLDGDLQGLVRPSKLLTAPQYLEVARQVVVGLNYIHGKGLIHRDIKSANLLYKRGYDATGQVYYQIKIGDFGTTRIADATGVMQSTLTQSLVGTLGWMAPEIFLENYPITSKVDIYALGMVLYEMYGDFPFYDWMPADIPTIREHHHRRHQPPPLTEIPKALWLLILQCWERNPVERPTPLLILSSLENIQF